jgi:hypothetical protein
MSRRFRLVACAVSAAVSLFVFAMASAPGPYQLDYFLVSLVADGILAALALL